MASWENTTPGLYLRNVWANSIQVGVGQTWRTRYSELSGLFLTGWKGL